MTIDLLIDIGNIEYALANREFDDNPDTIPNFGISTERLLDVFGRTINQLAYFFIGEEADLKPNLLYRIRDACQDFGSYIYTHHILDNLTQYRQVQYRYARPLARLTNDHFRSPVGSRRGTTHTRFGYRDQRHLSGKQPPLTRSAVLHVHHVPDEPTENHRPESGFVQLRTGWNTGSSGHPAPLRKVKNSEI